MLCNASKDIQCHKRHPALLIYCRSPNYIQGLRAVNHVITDDLFCIYLPSCEGSRGLNVLVSLEAVFPCS